MSTTLLAALVTLIGAPTGRALHAVVDCDALNRWTSRLEQEFPKLNWGSVRWFDPRHYGPAGHLFEDATFAPVFGKPFDQLSERQRRGIADDIRKCVEKRRTTPWVQALLVDAFTGLGVQWGHAYLSTRVDSMRLARDRIATLRATLDGHDLTLQGAVALLPTARGADATLAQLWPSERAAFVPALDRITQAILGSQRPMPLGDPLDPRSGDFIGALHVRRALDAATTLPPAAAMLHLDSAMTGQGAKVIAGARSYVASELRFAVHHAKQALQDDASAALERELAALPTDASGVGPGTLWYRRWEQLSDGGRNTSFRELGQRFTEIRIRQLTALATALAPRIEAAASPNAITVLLAQHDFLESDQKLAPMVRLGELAFDRRELLRALAATGMTERQYRADEALARTQDEPTAGDLYRAMGRWFARINAEQARAVQNCSRVNPWACLQALAGSAGTGGTAPMEVWITRFRKRACVRTDDARSWDCQFELGFDSNMSVSSTPFGALFRSGAGDTGRGYFGEARYGWEFEPRR